MLLLILGVVSFAVKLFLYLREKFGNSSHSTAEFYSCQVMWVKKKGRSRTQFLSTLITQLLDKMLRLCEKVIVMKRIHIHVEKINYCLQKQSFTISITVTKFNSLGCGFEEVPPSLLPKKWVPFFIPTSQKYMWVSLPCNTQNT